MDGLVFSVSVIQGFKQTFSSVDMQAGGKLLWRSTCLTAGLLANYTPSHKNWGATRSGSMNLIISLGKSYCCKLGPEVAAVNGSTVAISSAD